MCVNSMTGVHACHSNTSSGITVSDFIAGIRSSSVYCYVLMYYQDIIVNNTEQWCRQLNVKSQVSFMNVSLCLILILTVKSRQCPEDVLLPRLYRKLHSGMKTYGCELCGKRFLDSLRLRMHLLSHSGKNQHLCVCTDICLWMCIYTACIYKNNTVHVEIFHPVFNTV
jgi:hypothetical protein